MSAAAAIQVKPWEEYVDNVLSGKRLAGELEKLSVERCVRLMKDPRYFFDESEAERVLEILSLFRHTKGKYYGKPFELFPWQKFFFAYIFGLKYKDTDIRVVRKILLCMAKKGGKSEIGGALGAIMTFYDGEMGAECYSAANKYDQAKFSWDAAKKIMQQMAREDEEINSCLKVYDSITNRAIMDTDTDSVFKPLAADAKTIDGVNPYFGLVDEYHEAKDSSIPDNLESGMVAREQPMLCIITTRGFNRHGVLGDLEDSYIAILRGQSENDSVFPLIFALDEGDDWQDKSVWVKANPGLGRAPTLEGLEQEYQKAITEGARREISFRTKNLNQWMDTQEVWVSDRIWRANKGKFSLKEMQGKMAYLGIDLSIHHDISGYGILFPPDDVDGKFYFKAKYYCPEEGAMDRSRKDRVPYLEWANNGLITLTPGNMTDYRFIEQHILEDNGLFHVIKAAYDPYQANYLAINLSEQGIDMEKFSLIFKYCNQPIAFLEKLLRENRLVYDEDPVLRWMAGNVKMITNTTGLVRPVKQDKKRRIDGFVMLLMALAQYLDEKAQQTNYEVLWR